MPPSEYIIVLASIMIGLALADWATSLHRVMRAGSKVKWHGATLLFAILVLFTILEFWWGAFSELPEIRTIADFVVPMIQFILLVLLASVAWPDEVPSEGLSLHDYYFETHRYAWILFALYIALATYAQFLDGGLSIPNIIGIGVMFVLAASKNRWLHYIVLPLIAALSILSFLGRQLPA